LKDLPKFIRPGGGFKIVLDESVQSYVDSEFDHQPAYRRHWNDLLGRIKMTALREGTECRNGYWTILANGAPMFGVPTVTLIFTHDFTTLYIKAALFWQDGDHDPDDDL
jgi:hypothetical protein